MTAKDLTKFTGVAPRTLDFWVRSELLKPSITAASGSGSKREYSMADVVKCRVAVLLRDIGLETSRIGPILRRVGGAALIIVLEGGEVRSIPKTSNLSTFQPNNTAMLLINIMAITASLDLKKNPLRRAKEAAAARWGKK